MNGPERLQLALRDETAMVRAKMICNGIQDHTYPGATGISERRVLLHPVYECGPNGPNAAWSKYTPSGEVRLTITNPAAFEQFEQGKAYYVDFHPTDV